MNWNLIFSLANLWVLPAWAMLAFFPARRITRIWVQSQWVLLPLAGLYVFALANGMDGGGGFGSIAAVRQLFASDAALVAGWVHYLAFDLFVGAAIASEAEKTGTNRWLTAVCLFATFMAGPAGWLLFRGIQAASSSNLKTT